MQMEFKIRRILPVFAALAFLWAIFLFSKLKLEARENANGNYIPANSSWVLRIDGKAFLESAVYDVVYQSGDEEIFQQLKALSARNAGKTNLRDAGIDFFSDVIIFSAPYKNIQLTGVLVNLSDASQFEETMPELMQRHQAFASKGQAGIILLDASGRLSGQELKAQAVSLISSESQKSKVESQKSKVESRKSKVEGRKSGKAGFLGVEWNNAQGSGAITCALDGRELDFSGTVETLAGLPSYSLQADGFHLSTPVFSQLMQDSLRNMLGSKGFNLPDILHVSANYRGTSLANGVAPLADLLLEFESQPDLRQFTDNDLSWNLLGFSVQHTADGLNLTYGGMNYVLKAVGPKTVFIGQKPSNVQQGTSKHLFVLQGDLKRLTRIENGGLIAMGINLYPPYKASRQLFEAIDVAEVKVVPRGGKYALTGKIKFSKGKYPVSESLRCVLEILNGADL